MHKLSKKKERKYSSKYHRPLWHYIVGYGIACLISIVSMAISIIAMTLSQ